MWGVAPPTSRKQICHGPLLHRLRRTAYRRWPLFIATAAEFAAFSPLSDDGRVGTIEFAFDVPETTDVTTTMKDDVGHVLSTGRDSCAITGRSSSGPTHPGTSSQERRPPPSPSPL
jgi:hypothetical protein